MAQRPVRPSLDDRSISRQTGEAATIRAPPTGPRGFNAGRADPPPRSLSRKVDPHGAPLMPGNYPAVAHSSEDGYLQAPPSGSRGSVAATSSPDQVQDSYLASRKLGPRVSSSGPSTPLATAAPPPPTSTSTLRARAPFTAADFPSSINAALEAEVANLSASRLAESCAYKLQPASISLRTALAELTDVELELAGARYKTATTENSLDKLREEFEAYTVEAGRAEAKSLSEPWLVDV